MLHQDTNKSHKHSQILVSITWDVFKLSGDLCPSPLLPHCFHLLKHWLLQLATCWSSEILPFTSSIGAKCSCLPNCLPSLHLTHLVSFLYALLIGLIFLFLGLGLPDICFPSLRAKLYIIMTGVSSLVSRSLKTFLFLWGFVLRAPLNSYSERSAI
jgi:hypothetical protein